MNFSIDTYSSIVFINFKNEKIRAKEKQYKKSKMQSRVKLVLQIHIKNSLHLINVGHKFCSDLFYQQSPVKS